MVVRRVTQKAASHGRNLPAFCCLPMTDAAAGTADDDDDRNISMVYTLLVDIVYQSAYTSQFI